MSNHLDFSVRLQMLTDSFNQNAREAGDRFAQMTRSIQQRVTEMNADTQRATDLLGQLGSSGAGNLTADIERAALELRRMGSGAQLTQSQIDTAMQQAALHTSRLAQQLRVAKDEAERLGTTSASPDDIDRATAEVNRLETELQQASRASNSLADEMARAMNRASDTADGARNAIYRMTQLRMPNDIRTEVDQLRAAVTDFQQNSGAPASEIERVTRAATEQIDRLERELNGLDEQIDSTTSGTGNLGGNIDKLKGAFGSLQGILAAAGLGIGIAEIIETADAFKTLEARIKLATGEGAAFISGFEGVKQIANDTFSSVEATGELFAKIAASAEALELAQSDVLGITKTINEAIKLSGGSAASAEAAIIQLNQGLASGQVRGEEFNSIMEQAPRLAQAMADGLGVTRGELRGMAADGALTSEVVIKAVQSQGDAIASEFGTLPTTVGDSLQVVKNKIFNFIGEIDSTLNQTSKLAEAISYIGDSLENIDPGAVSALTGAFESTVGVVVELAKGIKLVYDTFNGVINAIAGGSADAAEQVGLITAALHGLNVFMGFVRDGFSAIGVAAGFVVASLYGAMSDLANIAASITFGNVSDSFKRTADELQAKSKETWDSAEQDVLNWESSGAKAITNAAKTSKERFAEIAAESEKTYNKMIADGDATAEAIEGQLVKMVSDRIRANDMTITDDDRVLLSAKGLQAVISDTGKVSIESATKTSKSFSDVGESFAELALKGERSGISIRESLHNAIEGANTKEAVQDIILSLEVMGKQGKISGEDSALGFELAHSKLQVIQEQTDANMVAFTDYAAEVIKKSGGINDANREVISAQLEQEAVTRGLAVQISETGDITVTELDRTTIASKRTKEQIDELAGAVGVGLSKEFLESKKGLDELVDGFDDLEASGYDAGSALVNALDAMSNKASNTAELENLTATWNELYKEGKITGQELADGLEGINRRADLLKEGINGVAEAYGFLGLKTREELAKDAKAYTDSYYIIKADGTATAQQLQEVFEKAAKANIAANDGVIDKVTARMAAERGVTIAIDEQGRVSFEKAGQAVAANERVIKSVNAVASSHSSIGIAANDAGNSMKSSADKAYKAYDKLQGKLEKLKEAQDALAEKRQKELAPPQGNQFGTRSGVENFFKSSGLDEKQAAEQARKLYAKAGKQDGALNFAELQGFKEGQLMTTQDLQNFKSASVFLSEIAQKAKSQSRDSSRTEKEEKDKPESKPSSSGQSSSPSAEERRQAQLLYNDRLEKLLAAQDSGASAQALSDLTKMVEVAADQYKSYGVITQNLEKSSLDWAAQSMGRDVPKAPDQAPPKTVKIEIKQGSKTITADVPAGQENDWTEFARQLGESRSVAGY